MEDQGLGAASGMGQAFRKVFGDGTEAGISSRELAKFLAVAAGLAVLLFLRRPDSLFRPQFWAEDGAEFYYFQFHGSLPLFKPYSGYLHFVPRAVAAMAGLFPIRIAPLIYNLSALALAALCSAWFSLPLFRHLVRSDRLRVAACIFIAAMPAAGTVLLNLTNVQWYLLVWLGLVCFQPFPATLKGRSALAAAWAAAVLSSIVSVVLAPVLIARAVLVKRDRWFGLTLAAMTLGYAVVLKIWLSPSAAGAAAATGVKGLMGLAGLIVSRVGIMGIAGPGAASLLASRPGALFTAGAAGLAALIGLAVWRARPRGPFAAFTVLAGYLVASSIAMLVLFRAPRPPRDLFFTIGGARYFFFGVAVFYAWLAAAAEKLIKEKWPRLALYLMGAVMLAAAAANFRAAPLTDADWPRWAAGLEAARQSGSVFPADVPINPRGWFIRGSGELPANLERIGGRSLRVSGEAMDLQDGYWVRRGPDAGLVLALPAPRYVYAVSITYAMRADGKGTEASAKISWQSPGASAFKTDPGLPALGPTPSGSAMRLVWVLDTVSGIRLAMSPGVSSFSLLAVTVLAAPAPRGR